jgi:Domain of unknown function (DUF4337)
MEEIEVPLEASHEHIHKAAHHSKENWIGRIALFSALLAVIAAISALMAGHHSNEAMVSQIKASDAWGYYQAKSVKSLVLQSRTQLLADLGKPSHPEDEAKLEEYKKDEESISEQAKHHEEESEHHLRVHEILAKSVTLFQIAIAISAISVLTKRRRFWYVGLGACRRTGTSEECA